MRPQLLRLLYIHRYVHVRALHARRSGSVSDCAERPARRYDSASGRSYISVQRSPRVLSPVQDSGSGYLTITTTEVEKIPAEGTRITPAYNPLLPTIQAAWTNTFARLLLLSRPAHQTQRNTIGLLA